VSRDAIDYRGALEAVERILNRGGNAQDVLRGVLEALGARGISFARVRLTRGDALEVGERRASIAVPIAYEGSEIGSLELATDDRALAERVAMLISHEVALRHRWRSDQASTRAKRWVKLVPRKVRSTFRLSAPGARCRPRSGGRHSYCADLSPLLL
jgi:hypothetical protein